MAIRECGPAPARFQLRFPWFGRRSECAQAPSQPMWTFEERLQLTRERFLLLDRLVVRPAGQLLRRLLAEIRVLPVEVYRDCIVITRWYEAIPRRWTEDPVEKIRPVFELFRGGPDDWQAVLAVPESTGLFELITRLTDQLQALSMEDIRQVVANHVPPDWQPDLESVLKEALIRHADLVSTLRRRAAQRQTELPPRPESVYRRLIEGMVRVDLDKP